MESDPHTKSSFIEPKIRQHLAYLEDELGKGAWFVKQAHTAVERVTNSEAPHIAPARGPPLWDDCDAQKDDRVQIDPDWDLAAQPAPEYQVDQRVNW